MMALAAMAQQQQPQQAQPQQPMSKSQLRAGLHHFSAVQRRMEKLLSLPNLGKSNVRPAIADATADLMIEKVLTLPEAMNALKLVPNEPGEQKAWVQSAVKNAEMAQMKLTDDYISQGPGDEPDNDPWSMDNHKTHMDSVMTRYKVGQ